MNTIKSNIASNFILKAYFNNITNLRYLLCEIPKKTCFYKLRKKNFRYEID